MPTPRHRLERVRALRARRGLTRQARRLGESVASGMGRLWRRAPMCPRSGRVEGGARAWILPGLVVSGCLVLMVGGIYGLCWHAIPALVSALTPPAPPVGAIPPAAAITAMEDVAEQMVSLMVKLGPLLFALFIFPVIIRMLLR